MKALVCSGTLAGPRGHYEKKGFRGVVGKPYTMAELRGELESYSCPPESGCHGISCQSCVAMGDK